MTQAGLAGLVAGLLLLGIAGLYLALALGAPLGAYAWGGEHRGVLPQRLRTGSLVLTPLIVAMAVFVFIASGVVLPEWRRSMTWAVWVAFVFAVMITAASWRSKSREEKRIMAPVCLVVAGCLLMVQFGAASPFSG